MQEKVIIEINSQLTDQEGRVDEIGFITEGVLSHTDNRICLTYEEQLVGMEGVTTTIRAEGDEVVLLRHGPATVRQVFRKGKPDVSTYGTPFGELPMTIFPERVEYDFSGTSGRMFLEYDLNVGGEFTSHNIVEIKVRGKGKNGSSRQSKKPHH